MFLHGVCCLKARLLHDSSAVVSMYFPVFWLIGALAIGSPVGADVEKNMAPIGGHFPIFVVEKSENPQNTLIAFTKLDASCRILEDTKSKRPFLDYYWMMDRKSYKPVHPIIKNGIRRRLELQAVASRPKQSFLMTINDLRELRHDLGSPSLEVIAEKSNGRCAVYAFMKMGPSDQNRLLRLESLYTESRTSLLPPFRKVVAVTVHGFDAKSGSPVSHRYPAR